MPKREYNLDPITLGNLLRRLGACYGERMKYDGRTLEEAKALLQEHPYDARWIASRLEFDKQNRPDCTSVESFDDCPGCRFDRDAGERLAKMDVKDIRKVVNRRLADMGLVLEEPKPKRKTKKTAA